MAESESIKDIAYVLLRDSILLDKNADEVDIALNLGADPNKPLFINGGKVPIMPVNLAILNDDSRGAMLKLLINSGAKVEGDPFQEIKADIPIIYAASSGSCEAVRFLLEEANSPINVVGVGGFTPLINALSRNRVSVTKMLLDKGADPNYCGLYNGKLTTVPLDVAIFKKNAKLVSMLIDYHADVNRPDSKLNVPLHYAVSTGSEEIIKILLDAKASIDNMNSMGQSPLAYAIALDRDTNIAVLLIDCSADCNQRTKSGKTPIMIAIEKQNTLIVKKLIDKGVDLSASDINNKNALSYANDSRNQDIINMVVQAYNAQAARQNAESKSTENGPAQKIKTT